ncbi:hypothetical protein MMC14_009813 [Varicellaria rhodocarpa]|nr:hypothetical protein [Varicellaria rhodocarpa]
MNLVDLKWFLLSMDPTSADSVQAAHEIVETQIEGELDYLVNNAGQTVIIPMLDFTIEAAKEMLECGERYLAGNQ